MEYLIGAGLSLAIAIAAMLLGFDRERVYYPVMLIVIASYYILFACMGGAGATVVLECLAATGFLLAAAFGFSKNLWWVVAALLGHGVFDFVHHGFIENPGVPTWWPGFCLAFDAIAGICLAAILLKRPGFFHPIEQHRT